MSNTIDEKVVEMRFDNRQFEANVKQSMNTLDKLNDSLKMTESAKGLENVKKASEEVTFDEMSSSLETVKAKFSSLQIVGITVISRLTNSAMDAAKKIKNYTIGAITEGGKKRALNIEQAKFQFKGLKMDVEKSMESALEAVKGTAYGLDEAAMVASQFGASGMKAGEKMTRSLKAVAGLAAMTGSSYSDIGRIFTQTAGQGRLMGDQLLQISQRGINAAASISKFLNKSEEDANRVRAAMAASNKKDMQAMSKQMKFTEADIRAMVSGGVLDFETFSNAMDDAFGEHAKDANKTFTGALANVRAALSRIGADFATPSFERARKVLNGLIPVIDGIHDSMKPLIGDFETFIETYGKKVVRGLRRANGEINKVVTVYDFKELEENGLVNGAFIKALKKTAKEHNISVKEMLKHHKSFEGTLKEGWLSIDILNEALGKYKKSLNNATKKSNKNTKKSTNLTKKQRKELKALYKQSKQTGTALNDLINKKTQMTTMELMVGTLQNLRKSLVSVIRPVRQAYNEIFPKKAKTKTLRDLMEFLYGVSEKMILTSDTADKVKRSFAGVFAVLDIFKTITNGAVTIALRVLAKLLGIVDVNILDITAAIGDALVKFRDWLLGNETLNKIIDTVVDTIVKAIDKFKEWFDLLKDSPAVKETAQILFDYLADKFKTIGKWAKKGSDKVTEFFDALSKMSLDDIKKKIGNPFESITSIFSGDKKLDDSLKEGKDKISNFSEFLQDKTGVDLNQVLRIGGAVGGIKLLTDAFKNVNSPISTFTDTMEKAKGAIKAWGKLQNAKAANAKYDALLKIAKAIAIVAGSIALLAYIPEDGMNRAYVAMAVISTVLLTMMGILTKASQLGMADKVSLSVGLGVKELIAIAGSIFILVLALKKLSGIDHSKVGEGLQALTEMLGLMVAFIGTLIYINHLSGGIGTGVGITTLIGVAGAMWLLADTLEKLDKYEWEQFDSTIRAMGLIFLGLSLVLGSAELAGGSASGAGIGIVAIAGAIWILVEVIKKIDKLTVDNPGKVIGMLAGIVVGMIVVLKAINSAGPNAFGAGIAVLAIAGAIWILVEVIKGLQKLNSNKAFKGVVIIAVLLLAIRGVIKSMASTSKYAFRAGVGMMAVAGAIAILALVVSYLGNIPLGTLAKGVGAVAVLMGMIALIMKMSSDTASALPTLIGLSVAVAVMAAAIYILGSKLKPAELIAATASLTILLGVLTGIMFAVQYAQAIPVAGLVTFGLLAAIVLAIAYVMSLIADKCKNIDGVVSLMNEVSKLMLVMSAVMVVLSVLGVAAGAAIGGVAAMAVVIAGISGILVALAKIQEMTDGKFGEFLDTGGEIMGKIGEAIGNFVGGIFKGVAMSILSVLPMVGLSLSAFILAATPFLVGIKLFDSKTAEAALNLAKILIYLGAAKLVDALANMLGADYSVVTQLTEFGNGVMAYAKSVSRLTSKDIGLIKTSAEAAKPLTEVANSLPLIGGVLGDLIGNRDLGKFGDQLSKFGSGLMTYAVCIRGLSTKDISLIKTSAEAAKPLVEVAKSMPLIGGALGKLVGEKDLGKFGDQLGKFGNGLLDYATSVKDLEDEDIDQIKKSAKASNALVDLANGLPSYGGVFDFFLGEQVTLDKFGEQVKAFGEGLVNYVNSINTLTIDQGKLDSAQLVAESLVAIANQMPEGAAFWGIFGGEKKTLGDFSSDVQEFGEGLANYANALGEVDANSVTNSTALTEMVKNLVDVVVMSENVSLINFLKFMDSLATDIPKKIVAMFLNMKEAFGQSDEMDKIVTIVSDLVTIAQVSANADVNDLVDFTNSLPSIAKSVKSYFKILKTVDGGQLKDISEAITVILDYASSSVIKMGNANDTLSVFTTKLPEIAESIKSYNDILKGVKTSSLIKKTEGVKSFVDTLGEISSDAIDSFDNSFTDKKPDVNTSIKNFITYVKNTTDGYKPTVKTKFVSVGKYAIDGFVKGINDDSYKVKNAIEKMAKEAVKKAREELDINSPSRVFKDIGKFTIQGFVEGIIKNTKHAVNAVKGSIKSVIKAAKSEMIIGANIAESMTEDILGKFTDQMKNTKLTRKVLNATSEAVSQYAFKLYKNTDDYKSDTAAVKQHKKDLEKAKKEIKKYGAARKNLSDSNTKALKANEEKIEALEKKRDSAKKKRTKKRLDEEIKALKKRNEELKKSADKETKHNDKVNKKYDEAVEKRKKALKNLEKDEKTTQQHIKQALNDMVASIRDSVKDYIDPLQQSMETGINLFEKFERQTRISSNRVLKNMKSQVKGFNNYYNNLKLLETKGFSIGLINKLKELGISGANVVEAFAKMDASQMAEAEQLFQQSNLAEMNIRKYNQNLSFDLVNAWKNGIDQLVDEGLDQEVAQQLTEMGVEASMPFIQGLLSGTKSVRKKNIKILNQDNKTSKSLSKAIANSVVGSLAKAGSKGVKSLAKNVNKKNGKNIGENICLGLVEGVKQNTGTVSGACYNLGRAAYNALAKSLKVHSPSDETEYIGDNYVAGFVGGIINNVKTVTEAASSVGKSALDSLSETLSTVPEMVEDGINTDVTIRPVLDMSDVDGKANYLNSMFERDRAMRINSQISGSLNTSTNGVNTITGTPQTVVNNNYTQNISSPKYVSRIDIYRDTLRLVKQHA